MIDTYLYSREMREEPYWRWSSYARARARLNVSKCVAVNLIRGFVCNHMYNMNVHPAPRWLDRISRR